MSRPRGRSGRAPRGARVAWPPERRETARDAIEQLMRERGLTRRFDAQVEREARRARDRDLAAQADLAARRDLRALPTFTIDPAAARDFDDAISAQRISADGAGDGVRVWVHIADVSAYVAEGTPLDREAQRRATSVYAPGAVEPMLPRALSNDACSLLPGSDRLVVTVELDLYGTELRRVAFYRSLICSDVRLHYEQVDRIFAGRERAQELWAQPLAAARAAAAALADARVRQRGALTLDQPEPEFEFDERGEVTAIHARTQTESHRLVEHLMIAANEAVARLLAERKVPCLYRVHERPEVASVERLVDQLVSLGVPTPPVPRELTRAQAAELIGEVSANVERHVRRTAARALAGDRAAAPSGGRLALTTLVLRALQQAYYTPRNVGHAGLGSACYCHFTSPIRRYPDIVCHRALLSALGAGERAPRAGALAALGAWTSERERDAMALEREADDVARCFALERALLAHGYEQTFSGEVVGLIAAGAFVVFGGAVDGDDSAAGEMPPFEGMLPVRHMSPTTPAHETVGGARRAPEPRAAREWWELNPHGTILHGERSGATVRLGDPVAVQVRRVDASRGRVDLVRILAPQAAAVAAERASAPISRRAAKPRATAPRPKHGGHGGKPLRSQRGKGKG